MNKQEQIKLKLAKPIEVEDTVEITVPYTKINEKTIGRGKNKKLISEKIVEKFTTIGTVFKIIDDDYHIFVNSVNIPFELNEILPSYYPTRYLKAVISKSFFLKPTFYECGANPFVKKKDNLSFYSTTLSALLYKAGYGKNNDYFNEVNEDDLYKVDFNPFIIDADGKRQFYQRELVWTTEQKQLLIESIYNDIEIGKFLFRYNSWGRITSNKSEFGEAYNYDCIDGKQRFFAILQFTQNIYADMHGNYWDDLSADAQRMFLNYDNLLCGELNETATDEDVIYTFLTLNFSGTSMSKEHIEYVKTFKISNI